MYIYPENMKGKANLLLWKLWDLSIILIGVLFSLTALVTIKLIYPLAITTAYAFLTIRYEDMSIFDYIVHAFKFCVTKQQLFYWRCEE